MRLRKSNLPKIEIKIRRCRDSVMHSCKTPQSNIQAVYHDRELLTTSFTSFCLSIALTDLPTPFLTHACPVNSRSQHFVVEPEDSDTSHIFLVDAR